MGHVSLRQDGLSEAMVLPILLSKHTLASSEENVDRRAQSLQKLAESWICHQMIDRATRLSCESEAAAKSVAVAIGLFLCQRKLAWP